MKFFSRVSEYIKQGLADLVLWVFSVGILFASRVGLVLCFHKAIRDWPSWQEWLAVFGRGFWFDAQIAAYAVLPLMALSLVSLFMPAVGKYLWAFRRGYRWVLFAVLVSYCATNILFFDEYNESFNAWVFQVFYEDWRAILETAWASYPMGWGLLGIVAVVFGLTRLSEWAFCWIEGWALKFKQVPFILLIVGVLSVVGVEVVAIRGSYHSRPLKRRDAAMTENAFLVKIVGNPFHTLLWAYKDCVNMELFKKGHIPVSRTLLEAMAQTLWGVDWEGDATYVRQTKRIAGGPKVTVRPKHIFLIVMESQNNWPMIAPYANLGMNPELKGLSEAGFWIKSFLPSNVFTFEALCSIMTGLHEADLRPNFQKSSKQPYLTAAAPMMKGLGYEQALFFDAGYINWQRMDIFGRDQGFDEVIGAVSAGHDSRADGRVWGMRDAELLSNVLNKVDPDRPSFNLIMTVTNHAPFGMTEAELEAEGCPIKAFPSSLEALNDGSVSLRVHGHTWYGDRCVGDFIREAEKRFGPALFVITGDHWSRQFLNQQPGLYERTSVPLILYGPEVLAGMNYPKQAAGDHVDIVPTLVELVAPKGFAYHTHGKDLLDPQLKEPVGFGASTIITPDFIFDDKAGPLTRLPWAKEGAVEPDMSVLRKRYEALKYLAEWVVFDRVTENHSND